MDTSSSIISPLTTHTETANPQNNNDGISWWFKLITKGFGVLGGCGAMVAGVFTCLSFSTTCLVGGILQICVGFMAVIFEGPCCCPFLDFINEIGKFSDARPHWQKAVFYTLTSVVPILMCFSLSTVFGCGLVFVCGVLYGIMTVGKKADREEMRQKARGEDVEMKDTLIGNMESNIELQVPFEPK